MKKSILILLVLTNFLIALNAQQGVKNEKQPEQLEQYQSFSWKTVSNAKGYQVRIQKQETSGNWADSKVFETQEPHAEVLLFPGDYRLAVSPINVLGKITTNTNWIKFIVLADIEPHLSDSAFNYSSKYNTPVVYIVDSIPGVKNTQNQIVLSGENIYFPQTKFSLVPITESDKSGVFFQNTVDGRVTVKLTVESRDSEKKQVKLSCDSDLCSSGYYNLLVENPSGYKDSQEILLIKTGMPKITTSVYPLNKRMGVRNVYVTQVSDSRIYVYGKNITKDTVFTLKPIFENTDLKKFPFDSVFDKVSVPLTIKSLGYAQGKAGTQKGDIKAELSFDSSLIKTGYYCLEAKNQVVDLPDAFDVPATKINVLLLVSGDHVNSPIIKSIGSSYSKRDDITTIYLSGKNLNGVYNVYLTEPYVEGKKQQRISCAIINHDEKYKKLKLNVDTSLLNYDKYVLFFENEKGSMHTYLQLNSKKQFKKIKMTDLEAEELFYGPEINLSASENLQEPGLTSVKLQKKDWLIRFVSQNNKTENLENTKPKEFAFVSESITSEVVAGSDLSFKLSKSEVYEKGSVLFENTSLDFSEALKLGDAIRFSVNNTGNQKKYWIIKIYARDSASEGQTSEGSDLEYEIAVKIQPNTKEKVTVPYKNFKCVSKTKQNLNPENIIGFCFAKETENIKDFSSSLEVSDFSVCDMQIIDQVENSRAKDPIFCTAVGGHVGLASTEVNPFSNISSSAFFVDVELRVLDFPLFDLDLSSTVYPFNKIINANLFGKIFSPTPFGNDVLYFGVGLGYQNKPFSSNSKNVETSQNNGNPIIKIGIGGCIFHMIDLRFTINTCLITGEKFDALFSDEFSIGFIWKYRKSKAVSSGGDL